MTFSRGRGAASRGARTRRPSPPARDRAARPAEPDRPGRARPAGWLAARSSTAAILGVEARRTRRRLRPASAAAIPRRKALQARVGQADEPRPQERRGAQVRRRLGQESQQRDDVLDLVGVEEAEPLVDVGRDRRASSACSNSRWLSRDRNRMAMSAGRIGPVQPGLPVAHLRARARRAISAATAAAHPRTSAAATMPSDRLVCRGRHPSHRPGTRRDRRSGTRRRDRADLLDRLANRSLTNASRRRHRPEAVGDARGGCRPPGAARRWRQPRRRAPRRRRRGTRRSTASGPRRRRSTAASGASCGQAEPFAPRSAPAATPAPTGRARCPGTRRPARGGSAPRAGSGCGRTRPCCRAASARG